VKIIHHRVPFQPLLLRVLRRLRSTTCAGLVVFCPVMVSAAVDDKTDVDSASSTTANTTVFNLDKFYPGAIVPAANCPANEQKVEPATPATASLKLKPVSAPSTDVASSNRFEATQKRDEFTVDAKSYDPKKTMLIDIRTAKDVERLRIPDALAIDRSALLSRQFLKQQSLLLIGEDGDDQGTALLAQQMKSEGFQQVAVSRHGMRGWLAAHPSIPAAPGASEALTRLSALQFHDWQTHPQVKLIWLGSAKNIPAGLKVAGVIESVSGSKPASRESSFRRLLAKHLTSATALIVLLPEDNEPAQMLETSRWLTDKVVAESGYRVAVVAEGWQGYQRFLSQQQAIVAQKDMSLQRPCNAL
jgi:rhodanese-related sulfurtransferase